MIKRHWWTFGEPREEQGELVVHFYYQVGRHMELRIPLPVRWFTAAGGLPVQMDENGVSAHPPLLLTSRQVEMGKQLYRLLGAEAQAGLIRSFANRSQEDADRILYLMFSPPQPHNREWCLTLEDLPWEYLHDGEEYIANRYDMQVIRTHLDEAFLPEAEEVPVSSWRILLVTPFVQAGEEHCRRLHLQPLPFALKEVEALRALEKKTHGLVQVVPSPQGGSLSTLAELEKVLRSPEKPPCPLIHFAGHGVIYQDEPCLCFEDGRGQVDYVSVDRLRRVFAGVRDGVPPRPLPKVLFLNACSSSSRGRYSAGFASGLHDLDMSVIGYHSEIQDDERPLLAAESFYRSLCVQQSLKRPHLPASVINALASARAELHAAGNHEKAPWANLRAYLPSEISFRVRGRGWIERAMQSIYSHYAQWMNPSDYTDHLSLGFLFALLFGALLGMENLLFIFPETVLSSYLNYTEIISELIRIFLVGPLSFLAAAIWVARLSQRNHQYLVSTTDNAPGWRLFIHLLAALPITFGAGFSFSLLFSYSFSRLGLLTAQTKDLATRTDFSVSHFWYGLVILLGVAVMLSLLLATWLCYSRRETLHSYRSIHLVLYSILLIGLIYGVVVNHERIPGTLLVLAWAACSLITIFSFSLAVVKILKETCWRSYQKSVRPVSLSWRKLAPLAGGVLLTVLCYFWLEESVRFEQETIEHALVHRSELVDAQEQDPVSEKVLERALRQRAIRDVPGSIVRMAQKDWLLSVICADYLLYRVQKAASPDEARAMLEECLMLLRNGMALDPELQFKDYYCNIAALGEMIRADQAADPAEREQDYQTALRQALLAVNKDNQNFAYLDTLGRVELKLAQTNGQNEWLQKAARHLRQAEWCAFFLRSPRAREVRQAISSTMEEVNQLLEEAGR